MVTAQAPDLRPWRRLARELAGEVATRYTLPAGLDRDDLEQLGLLAAQRALESYQPGRGTTLRTWVAHRVRWHLIDVAREGTRSGRSRAEPRPGAGDDVAGVAVDCTDPTRPVEVRDELRAALGQLSYRHRCALALRYGQGYSLREVGRVLGVCESRACQIVADAFRRLGRPQPAQRVYRPRRGS